MTRKKLPETMGRACVVRIPERMLQAIDKIRAARLDRPSRSTMIRELLANALEIGRIT